MPITSNLRPTHKRPTARTLQLSLRGHRAGNW